MGYISNTTGYLQPGDWGSDAVKNDCAFWGGTEKSFCSGCPHVNEDKNKCRTWPDCRNRMRDMGYNRICTHEKREYPPAAAVKTCQWPGCKNVVRRGRFCSAACHSQDYWNNRKQHPDEPELWFVEPKRRRKRRIK